MQRTKADIGRPKTLPTEQLKGEINWTIIFAIYSKKQVQFLLYRRDTLTKTRYGLWMGHQAQDKIYS